jgi:hypothetical protein
MLLRAAPIDAAILSLVQLLQPASAAEVFREAHGTLVDKILDEREMQLHLERLAANQFLVRNADNRFVAAPRSYELITRSLNAKQRDKARLLWLNKQRYK